MRQRAIAASIALIALILAAGSVSAHIGVLPDQVPPESNQTFTVRVPNEKDEPTVKVRVEIPAGLIVSRFQPKSGWTREVERDAQQRITGVTWSGGQIGAGEYEDFTFLARTPKETGTLTFKNYQTYQSGETVEWVNAEGQDRPAAFVSVGAVPSPVAGGAEGVRVEGPGGSAAASPAAAGSNAGDANPAPQHVAAGAAAGSSGSDLSLVVAIVSGVLAVIAIILAAVALARRPKIA